MRPPIRMLGRGGRGYGRGGGRGRGRSFDEGPPAEIVKAGEVSHECEHELVVAWTLADKIPYFNASVFLENKRKIGKVNEILGQIHKVFITVKLDQGIQSSSFQPKDVVHVGTDKLLPLSRFTNPNRARGAGRRGSPGGRGYGAGGRPGGRGGSGRSGFRGGRGAGRSGGRFGGRGGSRGGGRGGRFGFKR